MEGEGKIDEWINQKEGMIDEQRSDAEMKWYIYRWVMNEWMNIDLRRQYIHEITWTRYKSHMNIQT